MNKINVIGTSGSGKSTFSRKLAGILQCSHVELDKIFWGPNWTNLEDAEFFSKLESALNLPAWVLDGNYSKTIPVKWKEVDMVIWLDYSFPLNFYRAITRALRRIWTQEELWEGTGNKESFKMTFLSKDSVLWWMITTHKKNKKLNHDFMNDPRFSHIKFIRLKTPQEAEAFLKDYKPFES